MSDLADGGETTRVAVRLRQGGGEAPSISRRSWRGGRKSCCRRRPKLRAKGAGAALRALLDEDCSPPRRQSAGNFGARRAAAVRPAGCARRDPGTDRTRDLPALRALSDGAGPKTYRRTRPRTRGPAGAGALARMDGPGRGGHLRLRRAGLAGESGARRRQGLQPRSDHRRHPRRIARASL